MSIYRQVHTSFWQDPDVLSWTPEEKYFFLYLLTNTKTKQCGIYELPIKIIVLETGYNDETVQKLITRFEDYGKIKYSKKTHEIAILKWLKYNPASGPKTEACVKKELQNVKNRQLIPLVYPIEGASQEEEEREKEEEKEQEEYCHDSEPYLLAQLLYTEHKKHDDKFLSGKNLESTLQRWADDIEKILRIDGRSFKEIEVVIKYSQHDGFWRSNILSGAKLRIKFDTLMLQSRNQRNSPQKPLPVHKQETFLDIPDEKPF